jgi:uncharacterized membrane protein YeaQ/YmgE (transglycosylase-associated protein family)
MITDYQKGMVTGVLLGILVCYFLIWIFFGISARFDFQKGFFIGAFLGALIGSIVVWIHKTKGD